MIMDGLRHYNKYDYEEICTICSGAGLFRGHLCTNCNGHGKVLVHEHVDHGDIKRIVHDYEPTPEVQCMLQRGLL